ncbi:MULTISPECIES: major tail protein [unclassified Streptococcus]|uniref:major tail protein n=1 Tax=unclassified Streptococcus TaxID=2608887 RepID=UPI00211B6D39|nr:MULTISPECIES: major tail protein [unclassified Streptococcus]MCQ9211658.1 phage tail protein [Streptococcus sp. B01]MCQ9213175.1 phage tail protein [Streptococcus sp. O1]MCQ9215050.1 phage tail protein [Streptococcus sp. O1]MCQ9215099.1 phage tail protein [Streptococcus sp. O1]
MVKNKVTFGLENVRWVEIVSENPNGLLVYADEVKRLPGAIELTIDPSGDSSPLKADNINYFILESNDGYSGKLKIANLTDEFCEIVLGEKLDPVTKVMTEVSNAIKKNIALMFQIEGDAKAIRHVLYNVAIQRPSVGSSTKDGGNVNTPELSFDASPRPIDKIVKRRTTEETPTEVYEKWFEKPFEPEAVSD